MSGFVGIAKPSNNVAVKQMLEKIAYRGHIKKIIEIGSATLGVTYSNKVKISKKNAISDGQVRRWRYKSLRL
jgi:hypothetical protein